MATISNEPWEDSIAFWTVQPDSFPQPDTNRAATVDGDNNIDELSLSGQVDPLTSRTESDREVGGRTEDLTGNASEPRLKIRIKRRAVPQGDDGEFDSSGASGGKLLELAGISRSDTGLAGFLLDFATSWYSQIGALSCTLHVATVPEPSFHLLGCHSSHTCFK